MYSSLRAQMIESSDRAEEAKAGRRAQTKSSPMDGNHLYLKVLRGQLTSLGVSSDEIDQRISGEWADLRIHRTWLPDEAVGARGPGGHVCPGALGPGCV